MSRAFLCAVGTTLVLTTATSALDNDVTLLLTFGIDAEAEDQWDGRIEVDGGELLNLEERDFLNIDPVLREPVVAEIDANGSWKVSVRKDWNQFHRINYIEASPAHPLPTLFFPVSVFATVRDLGSARVSVNTVQGDFDFSLADIGTEPRHFLDGRASAVRTPTVERLSSPEFEDDEPAIVAHSNGDVSVAWIAYRESGDRVLLRTRSGDSWSESEEITPAPADIFRCSLAVDGQKRLWAFWSEREGTRWHIWGRVRGTRGWEEPIRISSDGSNTFHRAASGGGSVFVAWQSFRSSQGVAQSDIQVRVLSNGRWSSELQASSSPANDWEPAIAATDNGSAYLVWDSYDGDNYDVFFRSLEGDRLGRLEQITTSPRFQAHATVAVDGSGQAWVAWDESGVNWGKDQGFLINPSLASPLHQERSIRVARHQGGAWQELSPRLPEFYLYRLYPNFESPQLHFDGHDTLTMVFRHWTRVQARGIGSPLGWENFVTRFRNGSWSTPVALPHSRGSIEKRPALARADNGRLVAAWMTDNRTFSGRDLPPIGRRALMLPQNAEVYFADLGLAEETSGSIGDSLEPFIEPYAEEVPIHVDEKGDVAAIRGYRIQAGEKTYGIYRGDLHRHTDVSTDFKYDGSLIEVYRYALDAAAFDFIAPTDHQLGFDMEFTWWQDEKLTDLFHVPGAFTPLFGYERSLTFPNGHRNVIFAHRGVRPLPIPADESRGEAGAAKLYDYLHENNGISMPHSSGTDQGTDFRDNDPEVEPLMEVFQGYRASYEYTDAPKAASRQRLITQRSGFNAAGYWWDALAKGLKIGVQASSDHWSTHISYACLIAEDLSREALFDAIKKRHAYGATDNIVLDFQAQSGGEAYIMGDIIETDQVPKLRIRARGTGVISQLVIVKNQQLIFESRPGEQEIDVEFVDQNFEPGDSYYYARVMQADGNLAWSSPIWIEAPP